MEIQSDPAAKCIKYATKVVNIDPLRIRTVLPDFPRVVVAFHESDLEQAEEVEVARLSGREASTAHPHFTIHLSPDGFVAIPRSRLGRLATILDLPEKVTPTNAMELYRSKPNPVRFLSMPIPQQEDADPITYMKNLLDQKVESVFKFKAAMNHAAVLSIGPAYICGMQIMGSERCGQYRGFEFIMDVERVGSEGEVMAVPILPDSVRACCPTFEDEIVLRINVHDQPGVALWMLKALIDRILSGESFSLSEAVSPQVQPA